MSLEIAPNGFANTERACFPSFNNADFLRRALMQPRGGVERVEALPTPATV